jgi:hypothetical protein
MKYKVSGSIEYPDGRIVHIERLATDEEIRAIEKSKPPLIKLILQLRRLVHRLWIRTFQAWS